MMKLAPLFAAALLAAPLAHADDKHHQGDQGAAQAQAQGPMAEGEIRKVDKDAKKITIKHGPLVNLDMPPMTMVFQVTDPALLDKVQRGDKVRFQADKVRGAYVVTRIEPAK